jgi:hypothetical protein
MTSSGIEPVAFRFDAGICLEVLEKSRKTLNQDSGVLVEIQTGHLPNASVKDNLLR